MSNPNNLDAAIEHAVKLENVEFAENPNARCACVLLLDTSGSMQGEPIDALNNALHTLKLDLMKDSLASERVELAVVTFDTSVNVVQDFVTVDRFIPPHLSADGTTAMGTALNMALNLVRDRKKEYKTNGISYYRPWIFMLTDGEPQGESPGEFERASQRLKQEENDGKVIFFPVGVGKANMQKLAELGSRQPIRVAGLQFSEMFMWLSKSMQKVSQSQGGVQVPLPPITWSSVVV